MRSFLFKQVATVIVLSIGVGGAALLAQTQPRPDLGSPPTQEEMGNLAWTSGPSGRDLPPGQGTAKDGAKVFAAKCAMCHGKDAEGGKAPPSSFSPYVGRRLGGGNSVPRSGAAPGRVTTLAYSVPWATALFSSIAVEMPFFRAGTLTADEVYGLTAFVLFKNSLIKEDEVMNRDTLPKVEMPNRKAFPASDEIYMDMKKRGCIQTFGICRD